MRKMYVKIKDFIGGRLRGLCDRLTPRQRAIAVIVMASLFALVNFYMIFRAVYDIGREDIRQDVIRITPLEVPDFVPADTLSDVKIREMEEFFNQFTGKVMSTDAEKLKQKQKIRKYLVFTGMFLLFLGCMWLIFAPTEKDRQEAEKKTGFNAELPDPRGTGIEADKMAAYEQADMVRRQEEKKRTLADFSALADGHRQENVPEIETAQEIGSENESRAYRSVGNGQDRVPFASSASAYNDHQRHAWQLLRESGGRPGEGGAESRGGTAPPGCRNADGRTELRRTGGPAGEVL